MISRFAEATAALDRAAKASKVREIGFSELTGELLDQAAAAKGAAWEQGCGIGPAFCGLSEAMPAIASLWCNCFMRLSTRMHACSLASVSLTADP
jgi:hypothetical protein